MDEDVAGETDLRTSNMLVYMTIKIGFFGEGAAIYAA